VDSAGANLERSGRDFNFQFEFFCPAGYGFFNGYGSANLPAPLGETQHKSHPQVLLLSRTPMWLPGGTILKDQSKPHATESGPEPQ
jgi:hypothetical protein